MNLFFKSYKFYIIFFLLFALNSPLLLGTDAKTTSYFLPVIQQIHLPSKYNFTSTTSIAVRDDGVIFIGKTNGILVIDGKHSTFKYTTDPVFLAGNETQVFYLTTDDFGELGYSENKEIHQVSLANRLPSFHRVFIPYSIEVHNQTAFFATSEGISVYKNDSIHHTFLKREPCMIHLAGDNVFSTSTGKKFSRWNGTAFEPIRLVNPEVMLPARLVSMIDEVLVVIDSNSNVTAFDPERWLEIPVPGKFNATTLVSVCQASADIQIVCRSDGAIRMFDKGIEKRISLEGNYLPARKPVDVYTDSRGATWFLFSHELYCMNPASGFYSLYPLDGRVPPPLVVRLFGDKLYTGNVNGFSTYAFTEEDEIDLTHHYLTDGGFIHLLEIGDKKIFAAGNTALISFSDEGKSIIDKESFSGLAVINDTLVYAVNQSGFTSYTQIGNAWLKKVHESYIHTTGQLITDGNYVFVITDDQKIYYGETGGEQLVQLPDKYMHDARWIRCSDRLCLINGNQLLSWDSNIKEFRPFEDEQFNKIPNSSTLLLAGHTLQATLQENRNGRVTAHLIQKGDMETIFTLPSSLDVDEIICLIPVEENFLLFTDEGLYRINPVPESTQKRDFLRIIDAEQFLETGAYRIISDGSVLPYQRSPYFFSFGDIYNLDDPPSVFRYRLSRYQEDWSDWTKQTEFEIPRVLEGSYTFQVQSRLPSGQVSDIQSLSFRVKAPFYRKWYAFLFYSLSLLIAAFLIYKWRLLSIQRIKSRIEARINDRMETILLEKAKSDKLVADLFPKGTADELKASGRAKSEKFEKATVLFSDIQGFTRIAEEMNPELLIDELDKFFFHFDSVVEKYNIEKIKTIGDAYMAAGGIPIRNSSKPVEVVLARLEMQYYMADLKKAKADIWDLRIGIHTGPVIAGVVGHKKLSYDIWGDTVNTASRMESSGEVGKVNISGTTYNYVKDFFICEYRGKLPVKYKGNIDMYFVTGLRPELSVDLQGMPNKRFFIKLKHLRLGDLKNYVFEQVLTEKFLSLTFHNKDYIDRFINQTGLLCRSEEVTEEETLIVQTAAIFLFSGLSETYENFENRSAIKARKVLPDYQYNERQIDAVSNLILATKDPYNAESLLEKILIDARMEYLGRMDFGKLMKLLFLEYKNNEIAVSIDKIKKEQSQFLAGFSYYTKAAERLREILPEQQAKTLRDWNKQDPHP